jgi:hypothetical protein
VLAADSRFSAAASGSASRELHFRGSRHLGHAKGQLNNESICFSSFQRLSANYAVEQNINYTFFVFIVILVIYRWVSAALRQTLIRASVANMLEDKL